MLVVVPIHNTKCVTKLKNNECYSNDHDLDRSLLRKFDVQEFELELAFTLKIFSYSIIV